MRRTGKEIAEEIAHNRLTPNEIHTWLADATAKELQDYLRWIPTNNAQAQHGRDTLNVVLSKENLSLQRAIKKLTIWLLILTFLMALTAFYQVYKDLVNPNNTITNTTNNKALITNPTHRDNQPNKITIDKAKNIKHKETLNK